jgi:hypothetical protein
MNKVVLVAAVIALCFGTMIFGESVTAKPNAPQAEHLVQFRLNDAAQACSGCL